MSYDNLREAGDVLGQHVVDPVEMGDADDDDFAQPPGEFGLPPHRAVMVEPGLRQRRVVQQELVDVEQPAPAPGLDASDDVGEFGMLGFFDQRNARHGSPRGWRPRMSIIPAR